MVHGRDKDGADRPTYRDAGSHLETAYMDLRINAGINARIPEEEIKKRRLR